MIMEQKMALESHTVDAGVFVALKSGHAAQQELAKEANLDQMQDLVDEMEEARADREEMQDFFADKAMEGQDEALNELDALEAEMLGEEMGKMTVGVGAIAPTAVPAQPVAQNAGVSKEDEDELALLMAWRITLILYFCLFSKRVESIYVYFPFQSISNIK